MKRVLTLLLLLCLIVQGFLCFNTVGVPVFVKEGDSVTLNTDIETDLQEDIIKHPVDVIWTFDYFHIAQISGYLNFSQICTNVQCSERFRDRLKLDYQTGSLTITNIRNTDSGVYKLEIMSRSFSEKIFIVAVHGFLCVSRQSVSVMEEDSVTINTGVKTIQNKLHWYFNATLIAEISGDLSFLCTDVQCDDSNERFRNRLKLDHLTGSLTITDTRNTDSGLYHLKEIDNTSDSDGSRPMSFGVAVHGVPAAERDEMKRKSVKEGESVTLDPRETNCPCDLMMWYFHDTRIDQSKICTDVQCKERFRDRLKLDHQTGSLTITDIRTTDSGLYTVKISNSCFRSRYIIFRSFSVSVTSLSSEFLVGLYVAAGVVAVSVLLIVALAAAVIYYWKLQERRKGSGMKCSDQVDGVEDSSPDRNDTLLIKTINESSSNQTETETLM